MLEVFTNDMKFTIHILIFIGNCYLRITNRKAQTESKSKIDLITVLSILGVIIQCFLNPNSVLLVNGARGVLCSIQAYQKLCQIQPNEGTFLLLIEILCILFLVNL